MPRVSVIIAAFNCAASIPACIASIRSQTFTDWEVIACDDASEDTTWDALICAARSESRTHLLRNEHRLGASATRNRCIDVAKGEFTAIQDADDVSVESRLQVQVDYLDANPDVPFVSSAMFLYDEHGVYGRQPVRKRTPSKVDFLTGLPFCHAPHHVPY